MRFPTVEDRIGIPAEKTRRGRWHTLQKRAIRITTHYDARLSVSSEEDAKSTRIEVKGVCDRRARQGVPGDNDFERQALEPVGRIHHDVRKPCLIEQNSKEVLLVIVRHANGDILMPQIRHTSSNLAARLRLTRKEPCDEIANDLGRDGIGGQHRSTRKRDVAPSRARRQIERAVYRRKPSGPRTGPHQPKVANPGPDHCLEVVPRVE